MKHVASVHFGAHTYIAGSYMKMIVHEMNNYVTLSPRYRIRTLFLVAIAHETWSGRAVFSYKLRYIVGFGLAEMAISTNPKPTIYRNLYENTGPGQAADTH